MKVNIKQHPKYTPQIIQMLTNVFECELEIYYEANETDYQNIEAIVLNEFRLTKEELFIETRKFHIVSARQSLAYLAKKHTSMTLNEIGNKIKKDHTTVIHSVNRIQDLMDTNDPYIKHRIENCINEIKRTNDK